MVTELLVYGDESGIDNSPYCVVAGWIASTKQWESFNLAWRRVIDEAGLPEFKSKQFFGRHAARKEGTQNPFRNWSRSQASEFLEALIGVVHSHYPRITPIGAALDVAQFRALSWGERNYITGASWDNVNKRFVNQGAPTRAYSLPFYSMVGEALEEARSADCIVHFVMDEQKVLLPGIQQTFERTKKARQLPEALRRKVGELTPGLSHEHEGIQAADLLAYCWHGWYQRRQVRGERVQTLFDLLSKHRREMGLIKRRGIERVMTETLENPEDLEILKGMDKPQRDQRQ